MNDTANKTAEQELHALRTEVASLRRIRDNLREQQSELLFVQKRIDIQLANMSANAEFATKLEEINEHFDLNYTVVALGENIGLIDEDLDRLTSRFFTEYRDLDSSRIADLLVKLQGESQILAIRENSVMRSTNAVHERVGILASPAVIDQLDAMMPWMPNVGGGLAHKIFTDPKLNVMSVPKLNKMVADLPDELRLVAIEDLVEGDELSCIVALVQKKNVLPLEGGYLEIDDGYYPIGVLSMLKLDEIDSRNVYVGTFDGHLFGEADMATDG